MLDRSMPELAELLLAGRNRPLCRMQPLATADCCSCRLPDEQTAGEPQQLLMPPVLGFRPDPSGTDCTASAEDCGLLLLLLQ
jgi:hypothetical protein